MVDTPIDVPSIAIPIHQLSLLASEELRDGCEEYGRGGEREPELVGGAMVEADCLEDDRED